MGLHGWDGGGGGDWIAMGLMMTVFWVAVIAAVIGCVHYSRQRDEDRRPTEKTHSQAHRLLDERFAKGDIDADEYTQRHDLLNR